MSTVSNIDLAAMIENTPFQNEKLSKRKMVQGHGINDVPFKTSIYLNGKSLKHPAYAQWCGILRRCFSESHNKQWNTYKDCTISEDWLYFSNYLKWWKKFYKEGYEVDKDILIEGNKHYSEETCVMVPDWLNSFILRGGSTANRKYKMGVVKHKGRNRYQAQCNHFGQGTKYIGCFHTEDEAHETWLQYKLGLLESVREELNQIDVRLYMCIYKNIINSK